MLFDEKTRQYLPPRTRARPHPRPARRAGGGLPGGPHRAGAGARARSARSPTAQPGRAVHRPARRAGAAWPRSPAPGARRAATTWCCSTSSIPTRSSCPFDDAHRLRGHGAGRRAPAAGRPARSGGVVQARIGGAARPLAPDLPGGARRVPVRDDGRAAGRGAARRSCSRASGRAGRTTGDAFPRAGVAPRPDRGGAAVAHPPHRAAAGAAGAVRGDGAPAAGGARGVGAPAAARRGAAGRAHRPGDRAAAGVRAPVRRGALRPARGHDPLAERGRRPRRFGQHAPAMGRERDAVRRRAGRGRATSCEHLSPDSEVALVLASEGRPPRSRSCRAIAPRVAAALAAAHRLGAARRLRRRAAPRDADAGQLDARRSADLRHHRPAGGGLGGRRARRCSAGGPEIVVLDVSGGAAVEQPRRGRPGRRARARGRGARGSRWSRRSRTSPPSRPRTWASPCASTASRWRAASSTCRPAGRARKRFVHTVSGGARQAEVVIDHDGFALDDRRACRVEASRGLRVLLVDGDPRTVRTEDEAFFLEAALRAGGVELLGHHRAARRSRQPRPRHATASCSWPTSPGRAPAAAAALDPLRRGRRRPVHLGRRSRRRRRLEPDAEGGAAAAARA